MITKATEAIKQAKLKSGKDLDLVNIHEFPEVAKIVVHMGIGKDKGNDSVIKTLSDHLYQITGQRPSLRKAKKSIAAFKVRAGDPVGLMVTLRGKKMAHFLEKLIHITLPSIRDFRGLSEEQFDKFGNYNIGIREHTVFPEISYANDNTAHGLQVTIATTVNNNEQAKVLLDNIGFPFAKKGDN